MFSDALVNGLREVFTFINATPAYKVVILIGYDNYFASGGTKDTLLAIQAGIAKFTDERAYELALQCPIPVIAAMQGHAIGAGWALGMFADFILFSETSEYLSPYLEYGFTPGAGSTLVFPEAVGYDMAREVLLTARRYAGRELRDRGMMFPVLSRDQVYPAALQLAEDIARTSRGRVIELKQSFSRRLRDALEETYQLELDMHATTFVGQPEILARIESKFLLSNDRVVQERQAQRRHVPPPPSAASKMPSAISSAAIEAVAPPSTAETALTASWYPHGSVSLSVTCRTVARPGRAPSESSLGWGGRSCAHGCFCVVGLLGFWLFGLGFGGWTACQLSTC